MYVLKKRKKISHILTIHKHIHFKNTVLCMHGDNSIEILEQRENREKSPNIFKYAQHGILFITIQIPYHNEYERDAFSSWRDFFQDILEGDKNLRSNFSVAVSFASFLPSTGKGLKQSQLQWSPAAKWGASLRVTAFMLGNLKMDEGHWRICSICENTEDAAYRGRLGCLYCAFNFPL